MCYIRFLKHTFLVAMRVGRKVLRILNAAKKTEEKSHVT
jgi:hypothetical protein